MTLCGDPRNGAADHWSCGCRGLSMRYLYLIAADLRGTVFDGCDFTKAELRGALIEGARFVEANFYKADLSECSGEGADFTGARLVGAEFYRSELAGSVWSGAWINASWMHETDLRGADLRGVWFGPDDRAGRTKLASARIGGADVRGAGGWVEGSADVGPPGEPRVLVGDELAAWFAEQGAPEVRVGNV
ncbi:pentapeptide repeat-containing protein [Nocardiopsis sp. LDBS1602]|uniref:pentapeptide repeat-containing protein n=1 Tax=Nocardiopsis sp. LDBS1602 TaxID=3109597 RepID=UPI002DB8758B|nr:pentapeptide repeat-containing protein [Nocardiopsis sp. LDBS1602]MEC3895953.1 pentapeptide repeat-containing protein [Nocardiopsis sp. LDBS1602]